MKRILLLSFAIFFTALAQADQAMDQAIATLQQRWAEIKYRSPEKQQEDAFEELSAEAATVAAHYPDRAEPLVWQSIITASQAGAAGGLGALSLVRSARDLLEKAEAIDPETLNGSVYTSLGSLYYQVPGWPLGFGNDKKARDYLTRALAVNPDGIDPNYFYGDFLIDQGEYQEAVTVLTKALAAPPRPGRELADAGRRDEINKALAKARSHL